MVSVFAAVVIYNKKCKESITCEGLSREKDINVMVVDNSTSDFGNNAYCQKHEWYYVSMGKNAGLAAAYNKALEILKDENWLLVLFDDDTEIPHGFFDKLKKTAGENPGSNIFLPEVYEGDRLLSPCVINNFRVKRAKNINIPQNKITGINSGMAYYLPLVKDYRYDERYFLDYIDHNFIRDMKKKGAKIKIYDGVLHQRFFDSDVREPETVKTRFKIFAKDFKVFCSVNIYGKIYCALYLFFRAIKLSIKYKDSSFISMI